MRVWTLFLMMVFWIFSAQANPSLQPFTTEYQASYKLGWFTISITGKQQLKQLANGFWQLDFDAKTSGAGLTEQSVFAFNNGRITPVEYRYSTSGLLKKDPQHQKFDAQRKQIEDVLSKKVYSNLWQDNLQDNLTYILQASLDLAAGKTDLSFDFYQKDHIKNYHYRVVGPENLKTSVGTLKTIKLERVGAKNRTIYAWFASDYNYRLVRLAEYKNGKVAYEMNVSAL